MTLYLLLSTGSTQEDPFGHESHDWKIGDLDVKNQVKQIKVKCDEVICVPKRVIVNILAVWLLLHDKSWRASIKEVPERNIAGYNFKFKWSNVLKCRLESSTLPLSYCAPHKQDSVVECFTWTRVDRFQVLASPEALHCVLEQDTLSSA